MPKKDKNTLLGYFGVERDQEWKQRPWRKYLEPYAVAIKTLLLQHLLEDRKGKTSGDYPIGTFVIYGVVIYAYDDLDKKLQQLLQGDDERAEGLRAARRLRARQLRLDALLLRHPNIGRLPVIAGRSEEAPLPEDKTVNDLLLQATTLSLTYTKNYISLFYRNISLFYRKGYSTSL